MSLRICCQMGNEETRGALPASRPHQIPGL
jgi:hypothetical protein